MKTQIQRILLGLALLTGLNAPLATAFAQGTAFTYQGRLTDGGAPANGLFDLEFRVFDAVSGGAQQDVALLGHDVAVSNGLFTATLDFGSGIFTGPARWLNIAVRPGASSGTYTNLVPRQPITATPYAIAAGTVTGLLPASQLTGTVPLAQLPSVVVTNGGNFTGTFSGNGSGLTSLAAANLTGTVADARLSANVARLNVPNTATPATGTPVVNSGFITAATVTFGGSGYTTPPAATVIGAGMGFGAVITATVSGGAVTALAVQNPGSGYPANATLTIAPPPSNASQVFSSLNIFSGVNQLTNPANQFNGTFAGNGSGLTSLAAANLTGTITAAQIATGAVGSAQISDGSIVNADISAAAGIADTKLATLSSVGKVANSATTATAANTPGTIVLRDASGNFAAGSITATTFSGNGAGLTNLNLGTPPPGMVLIPAGAFTMGDPLDGLGDAVPIAVTVSAFYMDANLVSWSQWQSVYFWATNRGYGFVSAGSGKAANHPVQTVNWFESVKWCNARSEQAGKTPVYYTDAGFTTVYRTGEVPAVYANWVAKGYRLPTEAEWEKAARGGVSGQRFPWGNVINQNLANYFGATASYSYDLGPNGYNAIGSIGGTSPATSPVGSFAANGYGLYDMAGNVFAWCWDWYGTPYAGGTDPRGPASGSYRVFRGGSWLRDAFNCRSAIRNNFYPAFRYNYLGFRSVLPPGQ